MRFEEFVLHVPGDEFRIRFHEHLTVLAGVGAEERAALIESLVGGLTGGSNDETVLVGTDHTGRALELRTSAGGRLTATFLDDDSSAPNPVGWFAPDAATLRETMVVTAADLGLGIDTGVRDDDPPALAEARATLRELEAERTAAMAAQDQAEAAAARVHDIDELLRDAERDTARHAYLAVRAEYDRVKAEAAAVETGVEGEEADRAVLAEAEGLHRLTRRWVEAADRADTARRAVEGDPIDPADIGWLAEVPAAVPEDLHELLRAVSDATYRVQELEARRRDLATKTMPEPEDARVLTLATADQRELWQAFSRLAAARQTFEAEQIRVGGLGPQATVSPEVEALEEAHRRWDAANEVVEERRFSVVAGGALLSLLALPFVAINPILAGLVLIATTAGVYQLLGKPWRARAEAAKDEARALEPLGVGSYLGYHMRRVDATLDPMGRDRLELAQADLSLTERAWTAVAGTIEWSVAAELETEVKAYAEAMRLQHGAVEALAQLRSELETEAQPARDEARAALLEALAPYGVAAAEIEGVTMDVVAAVVLARVELGDRARQLCQIAEIEAEEEREARLLDEVLRRLGYGDGPLETRFESAGWAIEQAQARQEVRATARPWAVVEADLARLQAEERALRRPEFAADVVAPTAPVDVAALQAERATLLVSLADTERATAVLERIADRHAAVQRRVAALEAEIHGDQEADDAQIRHIHHALLAHLTRAAKVGPMGEPVPVLLDDPLGRVPAERKWELMDMLRRLGERTQLLYLTDDPFIGAWARRRAQVDETITLLEPVD